MNADTRKRKSDADGVRIRAAAAGDASALSALAARLFEESFAADNTAQDMADYLAANFSHARQHEQIMAPDWDTLVGEDAQSYVAYAQVKYGAPPACIDSPKAAGIVRFYVDPRAHGRGVAQNLLASVVSSARQRGTQKLWLAVWENNARAIAFYAKSGFSEAGNVEFVLGSDVQRDVVMQRSLDI